MGPEALGKGVAAENASAGTFSAAAEAGAAAAPATAADPGVGAVSAAPTTFFRFGAATPVIAPAAPTTFFSFGTAAANPVAGGLFGTALAAPVASAAPSFSFGAFTQPAAFFSFTSDDTSTDDTSNKPVAVFFCV